MATKRKTVPLQQLPDELMRKQMRPIAMRLTGPQYEKLVRMRAADGLSLQEHARRAIDFYLAANESRAAGTALPPGLPSTRKPVPAAGMEDRGAPHPATLPARRQRPKVERR